jgi:hypothetical protein
MKHYTATPNFSARTFTIRTNGAKYRTVQMSKIEFNEALYFTSGDWISYIKRNEVIILK